MLWGSPDSEVHVGPRWALCWPHKPCYQRHCQIKDGYMRQQASRSWFMTINPLYMQRRILRPKSRLVNIVQVFTWNIYIYVCFSNVSASSPRKWIGCVVIRQNSYLDGIREYGEFYPLALCISRVTCCTNQTIHQSHIKQCTHFVTEMCTYVHISVTKWCIVVYLSIAFRNWPAEFIVPSWVRDSQTKMMLLLSGSFVIQGLAWHCKMLFQPEWRADHIFCIWKTLFAAFIVSALLHSEENKLSVSYH